MGHWDIVVIQSLSWVQLFLTPQTVARQASVLHYLLELAQTHVRLSDATQPSHPLLPPSPSALNPSSESALHIRWLKYWSFSLTVSPSNEYSGIDWFDGTLKTFTK